jgi:hypothetical protein
MGVSSNDGTSVIGACKMGEHPVLTLPERGGIDTVQAEKEKTTMNATLNEATQAYLQVLSEAGKSPRTLYTYGLDLATVVTFFGPETLLGDITPVMIGRFLKSDILRINQRSERPRSEITIQKNIRVMRQFFIWAQATQKIELLPLPKAVPLGRNGYQDG